MDTFYRLYSLDTTEGLSRTFRDLEKTVFFLYGWLSVPTHKVDNLRVDVGYDKWTINTFYVDCREGRVYLIDKASEEKINTLLIYPQANMFERLLRMRYRTYVARGARCRNKQNRLEGRPNDNRNQQLRENRNDNRNRQPRENRNRQPRKDRNPQPQTDQRRRNNRIFPRSNQNDRREKPRRDDSKPLLNPLKLADRSESQAKLPLDNKGNPIIPFDEEFEKQKEIVRNGVIHARKEIGIRNAYSHDKQTYLRMRKDIENGTLPVDSIPEFFADKYEAFRIMELREDLNDPNIDQEFERYINLLKVFRECKLEGDVLEDVTSNSQQKDAQESGLLETFFKKDTVYVPHNYHYLTDAQKEECAKKYNMTKAEFEEQHITKESSPNNAERSLLDLLDLTSDGDSDAGSEGYPE